MRPSLTTEEMIENFKKVHGDKYDYSKVIANGTTKKVIIGCEIHGYFEQLGSGHARGFGCNECGKELRKKIIRDRKNEKAALFFEKARSVHGDKYDYSMTAYIHSTKAVSIFCPIEGHGIFTQKARVHLNGKGCTHCALEARNAKLSKLMKGNKMAVGRKSNGQRWC